MVYQEIVNKIITLLKADANLAEPDKIKKYYLGRPAIWHNYPFISVRWVGGPINPETTVKERYEHDFEILVADRSIHEDYAEKKVMDFAEDIDRVLDANPTLDGLVVDSHLSNVISDTEPEGSQAVVGAIVTLSTLRIVT